MYYGFFKFNFLILFNFFEIVADVIIICAVLGKLNKILSTASLNPKSKILSTSSKAIIFKLVQSKYDV